MRKATRTGVNRSDDAPATERDVHLRVFEGHKQTAYRVAMPEDGRFALTSGEDGTIRMWNLEVDDGKSEIVCNNKEGFVGLDVTADGSCAAAGTSRGTIHLIDIASARGLREWKGHHDEVVGNLAFIADTGELLSASLDGFVRRWNPEQGTLHAQRKLHFEALFGVTTSADGSRIVGAALDRGRDHWSGSYGAYSDAFKENVANQSPVSVSADGKIAFTGTLHGEVAKWDLIKRRRIAVFEGHSNPVSAVAVTLNGRFCVSGSKESVRLWAAKTGQCLAVLIVTNQTLGIAVTPDARRIAAVDIGGLLRVWDIPEFILTRATTSKKRGYVNAKVVLLGNSGVGKTGLALRMWHDRWEPTESTHGMEIQRLELPQAEGEEGVEHEVWLWDLAGQPDYRLTNQLFMEQTSLALLVFDPQDSKVFDTVGYWQSAVRKVASAEHVEGILVAARCDRPGLRLTLEEVREWAADRSLHGPVLTAAKRNKHPGAAELLGLIAKLLPWDKMEFRSTMENFTQLKDAVLVARDAKSGSVVVKPEELEVRVRKAAPHLAFTHGDLRAVTILLAGEGILYALPYGELVVLQPSWINCYASTLVKLAGEAENHLGHIPQATIQPGKLPDDGTPRLSHEDERLLLPALVALFLDRALVWKQDTDNGAMLVFPNYVRLPRPSPPPRPGRTVLYRFTGPLEEIYCTLVVRLHYSRLFSEMKLYRQAVDFRTVTNKLVALTMTEAGERGELEIYFGDKLDADLQASFQQFVHDHLSVKAANVQRLRNFVCPICKVEADRKATDAALANKRIQLICVYCDPERPGMIDLNDVLETQFSNKDGEAGAHEANRRAGKGISTASMEQVMVGEIMAIVASADQKFIQRVVRDEGTDGEIEFSTRSGESTGVAFRLQLKSGDSHLTKLKDGTEKFRMKKHYERYWAERGTVPVLLIIRDSDGRTRYMNATSAIRAVQRANPGEAIKQIVFVGENFTTEAVLRLRDERLR